MKDIFDILDALRARDKAADGRLSGLLLATLVQVQGSSYRRPGARALLSPEKLHAGLVSGGCLEADLQARGEDACGHARRVKYDFTSSEDIVFGLGLGCNGVIDVLLEPLSASALETLRFAESCVVAAETAGDGRQHWPPKVAGVIAHVFGATDARCIGMRRWRRVGEGPDGPRDQQAFAEFQGVRDALDALSAEAVAFALSTAAVPDDLGRLCRRVPSAYGELEVFVETLRPRSHLVLFGAGPDAVPLARLGIALGWTVTLMDSRLPALGNRSFPDACARQEFDGARCVSSQFPRLPSALCIMSHNFLLDAAFYGALAREGLLDRIPYVGLLGPRRRALRLVDFLRGGALTDPAVPDPGSLFGALPANVRSPMGLDLGGDGAEAVALSVASEIQSCLTSHSGAPLRELWGSHVQRTRRVHGLLLAAGSSRRLGHPKQLVRARGRALVQLVASQAHEAGLASLTVVVAPGDAATVAETAAFATRFCVNPEPGKGLSGSVRAGILSTPVQAGEGLLCLVCDQVALSASHLRALLSRFSEDPERIVASAWHDGIEQVLGVPAVFPASLLPELSALEGDRGARVIFARHPHRVVPIDFPDGGLDVDTPEMAELLRAGAWLDAEEPGHQDPTSTDVSEEGRSSV